MICKEFSERKLPTSFFILTSLLCCLCYWLLVVVLPAQGSIILEHCNVNRVMNGWYRYTLPVLMLVTFNIYYSLSR